MLLNTLATKQEPNMEQAIATLNALKMSSSFVVRLTAKIGIMIKATMEVAVLSLMFGKLTNGPTLTLPTFAQLQDITDAKELSVEMAIKGKMETATKTDAI